MDYHKKKKFLNTPKYPGGSAAFREFISGNLRYPEDAMQKGIQGSVIVGYEVLDTGEVNNAHIIKGLGYGCDEEALRLINMLRFEKVKNRGVRLTMSTKTTIHFHIPGMVFSYSNAEQSGDAPKHSSSNTNRSEITYNYTITL